MIVQQNRPSEFNLSPQAVSQLIRATKSIRDKTVVVVLAVTGMRRAEIADLRIDDIDFDECRIVIRNGKGGKCRVVFFPDEYKPILSTCIGPRVFGPLLLGRNGQALSVRTINNIIARVGRDAGMQNPNPRYKNITPHLLRHSFARNWKRGNGSIESLQRLLGHTSIRTTMELYGTESLLDVAHNYRCMCHHLLTDGSRPTAS